MAIMTALEYMKRQVSKHTANYEREARRGMPGEVLENIKAKIGYYIEAVKALESVSHIENRTN